jgi:hypothetical protein
LPRTVADLVGLPLRLGTAADVVEAMNDPEDHRRRGWNLSAWRFDLIPWGARFRLKDPARAGPAEVLALLDAYSRDAGPTGDPVQWSSCTTVLMLGARTVALAPGPKQDG